MSFVLSDVCVFLPPSPCLACGDILTLWLSPSYALCIRNIPAGTTPFQGICSSAPLSRSLSLPGWLLPLQPTNERTWAVAAYCMCVCAYLLCSANEVSPASGCRTCIVRPSRQITNRPKKKKQQRRRIRRKKREIKRLLMANFEYSLLVIY